MSLPEFIRSHHEEIIREFAAFAKTLMPPKTDMTDAELRDHAEEVLTAVVEDMHLRQTPEEQHRKSQGRGAARSMQASGRLHAIDRIVHGYPFQAVLAEFRALRASVLRLYEDSGATDLRDVRRFNEAIDEALMVSMREFSLEADLRREGEAFFLKLSDALRPLSDPSEVKVTATRLLGEQLGVNRVFYADAEDGHWLVSKGYETGVVLLTDQPSAMSKYGDWIINFFRAGGRLIVSDLRADGRFREPEREAHLALQIGAELAVPLLKAGELTAMLVAHNVGAREWTGAEITLLDEAAERTWAAVERARAAEALRASEEKYRTLFNSIDEGFCTFEIIYDGAGHAVDYRFVEVNPAFERHTGLADAVGRTIRDMVPGHEQEWIDRYRHVAETGEPLRIQDRAEGLGRWYDIYAFRIGDPDRRTVAALFGDITERKQAEGELRHRSDQFETLIQQAPLGVYLIDDDFRIAQVNPVARPVFGDIPDLIGRDFDEVIHILWEKSYADEVARLFRHTLETGEPYETPERAEFRADRGLVEYYSWRIDRITLPKGGSGVVCYFIDISDQVRARQAIAESEKKYRSLFESMAQGYALNELVRDADGRAVDYRFLDINPAGERLMRRTRADMVGRLRNEVLAPDPKSLARYAAVVDAGRQERFEQYSSANDAWYDLTVFPRGGDRFAVLVDDITERRKAAEALLASEARLRTVIESIQDYLIITLDSDGRITSWNEGARRMTGFQADEVLGRTIDCFYPPEEVAAGKPAQELQRAMETGRSEDESWRVRKDGSRVWVNEIVRPLRDSEGRVNGFAMISRDLTEGKAFEDALQQARDSLEVRVRQRTAEVQSLFTRLVSAQEEERRRIARDIHDQVGQQMTALRMNLETLRSQAAGRDALMEQAERTQRLAEELDQSIDFLTWQIRPAALDHLGLSAALQNLVTGWSERFGTSSEFAVDGVADVRLPRDVEANLYRIAQEALHNVAKHAHATQVTLYLTQQNGSLVLLIEDNGRGFDPHGRPSSSNGHGMGLMSMRERAALVGGRLEIDSSADHGTSIYVRIP